MDYRERMPSAALHELVRCYWFLSGEPEFDSEAGDPAFPDGSPELIFNLADPFAVVADSGERIVQPLAMLVGQISGPLTVGPTGRINLVAVRFEPFGASLLCDDMSEITDDWIDIADLHVPALRALAEQLSTATGDDAKVTLLNDSLEQLLRARSGPDHDVIDAVHAIVHSNGMVALEALASELGCTMRHLQRRFAVQVGLSPKQLSRIRRFQRVFTAWRDDPRSLSRVAVECGYFDQSHLIRDFRDFAGQAPAAFLANQPEFTQFFLPTNESRVP